MRPTNILEVLDKVGEIEARSRNWPTHEQKLKEARDICEALKAKVEADYRAVLRPAWEARHKALNDAEERLAETTAFLDAAYQETIALEKAAWLKEHSNPGKHPRTGTILWKVTEVELGASAHLISCVKDATREGLRMMAEEVGVTLGDCKVEEEEDFVGGVRRIRASGRVTGRAGMA